MDRVLFSWREMITECMRDHNESFSDVVHCTLNDIELDVKFYPCYGGTEGKPFTLWTHKRIYFPAMYDGLEWCASLPRNPCKEKTRHVGGG